MVGRQKIYEVFQILQLCYAKKNKACSVMSMVDARNADTLAVELSQKNESMIVNCCTKATSAF